MLNCCWCILHLANCQTDCYSHHICFGHSLYSFSNSICSLWKQERAAVENGPIALRSIVGLLAMSHVWFVTQILDEI